MAEKDFDLNRMRLDFIIEKTEEIGEKDGAKIFRFTLKLDPKVWDYDKKNKLYKHKKSNWVIPEDVLKKAAPTLIGKPIYVENIGKIVEENDEKYIERLKSKYGKNKNK